MSSNLSTCAAGFLACGLLAGLDSVGAEVGISVTVLLITSKLFTDTVRPALLISLLYVSARSCQSHTCNTRIIPYSANQQAALHAMQGGILFGASRAFPASRHLEHMAVHPTYSVRHALCAHLHVDTTSIDEFTSVGYCLAASGRAGCVWKHGDGDVAESPELRRQALFSQHISKTKERQKHCILFIPTVRVCHQYAYWCILSPAHAHSGCITHHAAYAYALSSTRAQSWTSRVRAARGCAASQHAGAPGTGYPPLLLAAEA